MAAESEHPFVALPDHALQADTGSLGPAAATEQGSEQVGAAAAACERWPGGGLLAMPCLASLGGCNVAGADGASPFPMQLAEFDFQGTFDRVKDAPCRVERIRLEGLDRTQRSVVVPALLRLVQREGTLDEIKEAALEAWDELRDLDIFEAIDVVLDQGSQVGGWVLWCALVRLPVARLRCAGWWWGRPTHWLGQQRATAALPLLSAVKHGCRRCALDSPPSLPPPSCYCSTNRQSPQDVVIVARFQERGIMRLHAGTYVQGTEGAHARP